MRLEATVEQEGSHSQNVGAPRAHRNLRVWQSGLELADVVYALTTKFPSEERYGLAAQMRRAAVSIASNVAEGAARASNAEFLRFLHAARGSLAELDTQIEIARRRRYLDDEGLGRAGRLIEEVGKTLQGLITRRRRIAMEQEATGRK